MAITQLSVFLANQPGELSKAVSRISGAGINIRALSLADTKDFGILRIIVSDVGKTIEVLDDIAVSAQTPVIALRMEDEAGALDRILKTLAGDNINIEYVYAFTSSVPGSACVVLRVDDTHRAEECLLAAGLEPLSDAGLKELFA